MIDFSADGDIMWLVRSAFHLGWPGLLIGIAIGVSAWYERRVLGSAVGGIFGLCLWATVTTAFF